MDVDKEAQLARLVCDPTIVSDGSLRAAIANLLGWHIDSRYYTDTGKPWAADYYARRIDALSQSLDDALDMLRERGLWPASDDPEARD